MSLKDKISDKLKALWMSVIEGSVMTKREIEWRMIMDVVLTVFFLCVLFSLVLVESFLVPFVWVIVFWFLYAIACFILYYFWKFSSSIIIKLMYGNGDDVDENGDEVTISRILEKALKNLDN